MEMHQVRYFLAVARTLNFTRAAEECNVAQPSLTRAIKLLEGELGGDLFRRERRHVGAPDDIYQRRPAPQRTQHLVGGSSIGARADHDDGNTILVGLVTPDAGPSTASTVAWSSTMSGSNTTPAPPC